MKYQNRLLLFAMLLVVAAFLMFKSIGELPERMVVHFGMDGAADGWMGREDYRLLMPVCLVALPSLLFWIMAGLPRLTNGKGQVPNNEYCGGSATRNRRLFA